MGLGGIQMLIFSPAPAGCGRVSPAGQTGVSGEACLAVLTTASGRCVYTWRQVPRIMAALCSWQGLPGQSSSHWLWHPSPACVLGWAGTLRTAAVALSHTHSPVPLFPGGPSRPLEYSWGGLSTGRSDRGRAVAVMPAPAGRS